MDVYLSLLVYLFLMLKLFCQYQQKSTFGKQFLVSSMHSRLARLYSKIRVRVISEFLSRTLLGYCLLDICLLFFLAGLFEILAFSSEMTFLSTSIACGFQLVECSFWFLLELCSFYCFYICFSCLGSQCMYPVYLHCLTSAGVHFPCSSSVVGLLCLVKGFLVLSLFL